VPDDNLELETGTSTPEGGLTTPAEPTPGSSPATPTLTAESVAELISQASESQNRAMLEALRPVQQLLEQQQANTPAPVAPDANELAERLLTDPKATIREEMNEWSKENLAGPFVRSFEVDRDERIESKATRIDGTFGEGFFDEHIRDRLVGEKGVLSGWPINQQADPRIIDSAISGIMGNDLIDTEKGPKVVEALQKTAKARQERNTRQAPHMMGPGRPCMAPTNVLSPEMKYALEGFQQAGIKITEADLKSAQSRGNSLEDYRKGVTQ
jgi:hypothetical protein